MAEAETTTNPLRLLALAFKIKDELTQTVALAPDNLEARLDLVRFYVRTPSVFGGDANLARSQAREIAIRDAGLGHYANGYIFYREQIYGPARRELLEAVRLASTAERKALAMRWLGWLSQETQQYATAFAMFSAVPDPYEVGRTAVFCDCELERGEAALRESLRAKSSAQARYYLGLILEKRGDLAGARREVEAAYRLDPKIAGIKDARKRLRK
ncbi:MAG TPA: hypothetical protein VGF69_13045 [Thermoanaerobaculia bacterium]|jgi:tetratricopeptide (TPR) repeat protein